MSLPVFSQDSSLLKRTPFQLKVAVDKESFYEEEIKATAFILPENTIQLYPGETIFVEAEQVNGIIQSLKAVKEIKDSSKTLIIGFTQSAKGKMHERMTLKITNPFPHNLSYNATIFLLKQNKWVTTNVYPVYAGISGIEIWPDVITSIVLNKWSFEK